MNGTLTDQFGSIASTLCALHCLVLSTLPWIVSLLGIELLANEAFEWGFFSMALLFAIAAAVANYRQQQAPWLIFAFVFGMLILLAGRLGEALSLYEGGAVLAICGGMTIAATHLLSLKQRRAASCCT